ncbi:hypothetical protein GSI_08032 [Ganoderma sinense ZZ0214-1]|uniref:Uncharacterized protein n=1 Tax=Ganoderma sinense ZZ0214-1 TaxID=1077348 RepID=A0A2G8S7V3_9APHY|nr:hypothetical protein GSI_08032 [Ganoderma sinense ZZ0214-1]
MPKIRNRIDPRGSAFPSRRSSPSLSCSLSTVTRDPSAPLFPDVPLNPQHRYCTPPPLDAAFTEQSTNVEVGFRSNMLTRDPSISDYLSLFEEPPSPPPPPPPGSQENPITLGDAGQGIRQPDRSPRGKEVAEAKEVTTPRRSPRSKPQTSTSRRASSGSQGKPYPTTSPNSSPASTASSSRASPRKTKTAGAGRKAPKTAARKKAATNKFAPSVSSPLSQVAFAASRERTLSPTPPPTEVHGRWYIPPRKHSTGSISASSESSSDSDSEPDYSARYYG